MDLKKIWENRSKILEGVTNTVFKKQFIEDIALYRTDVCNECQYKSDTKCEVPGTGPCCSLCGCNLKFKVRSLSSRCPAEEPKWKEVVNEDQEAEHDLYYDE